MTSNLAANHLTVFLAKQNYSQTLNYFPSVFLFFEIFAMAFWFSSLALLRLQSFVEAARWRYRATL
jgi:hypothetical protein